MSRSSRRRWQVEKGHKEDTGLDALAGAMWERAAFYGTWCRVRLWDYGNLLIRNVDWYFLVAWSYTGACRFYWYTMVKPGLILIGQPLRQWVLCYFFTFPRILFTLSDDYELILGPKKLPFAGILKSSQEEGEKEPTLAWIKTILPYAVVSIQTVHQTLHNATGTSSPSIFPLSYGAKLRETSG